MNAGTSDYQLIMAGVSQGSVLGSLLYHIRYTYNQYNLNWNDTALMATEEYPQAATGRLQEHLN